MDAYSSKREVEKPKTKTERRTILVLESRSYANTMEGLASIITQTEGRETPACEALRRGAKFIRELSQ